MRTAKQWVNEKLCINEDYDPEGKGDKQWEEEMQYVNAVRLEAFKAGMTFAARQAYGNEPGPVTDMDMSRYIAREEIKIVRDSLTELP